MNTLTVALGTVLFMVSIASLYYRDECNKLKLEKNYLIQTYESQKEMLEKSIEQQNKAIEAYKANIDTYKDRISSRIDTLNTSSTEVRKKVSESLSKDSSSENMVKQVDMLLRDFSK